MGSEAKRIKDAALTARTDRVITLVAKRTPLLATLTVDVNRIVRALWSIALTLVAIAVSLDFIEFFTGHDHLHGMVPMFSLTMETNVPTWFSGCILFLAALLLFSVAEDARRQLSTPPARYWYGLGAVFAYLSLDEFAQLHERLAAPLRAAMATDGVLYYAWVIPAMAMVLVVGITYLPFLFKIPKTTAWLFVLAAILYVGGAVGGELIEGLIYSFELALPFKNYAIKAVTTVEEGSEMSGVIIFIRALLLYIRAASGRSSASLDVSYGSLISVPGASLLPDSFTTRPS